MLKVWDIFPFGILIDNIVEVAKHKLVREVDYLRGTKYMQKYEEMTVACQILFEICQRRTFQQLNLCRAFHWINALD